MVADWDVINYRRDANLFVEPSTRNTQWALDVLKKNAKKSPYYQNHNMAMCNILITEAAVCDKGQICDKTAIYAWQILY